MYLDFSKCVKFASESVELSSIESDSFSVEPGGVIGDHEGSQIGDFFWLTESPSWQVFNRVVHELAGGVESREGAFGVDWTGRDAVESHSVAAPFDSQGLVERLYAGLGASRGDDEARTGLCVVGGDGEEDAGLLSGDSSLTSFESDVDRPLKCCFSVFTM